MQCVACLGVLILVGLSFDTTFSWSLARFQNGLAWNQWSSSMGLVGGTVAAIFYGLPLIIQL
jgi:hypothetical protein